MRSKLAIAVVVFCSFAAGTFCAVAAPQQQLEASAESAQRQGWEYMSIQLATWRVGDEVRRLGRDGWELVDVEAETVGSAASGTVVYYFKRPI